MPEHLEQRLRICSLVCIHDRAELPVIHRAKYGHKRRCTRAGALSCVVQADRLRLGELRVDCRVECRGRRVEEGKQK